VGGLSYQIYLNGKQYEEQALAQGVIVSIFSGLFGLE